MFNVKSSKNLLEKPYRSGEYEKDSEKPNDPADTGHSMIDYYENHSQEDEELIAQHLISLSMPDHSKIRSELDSDLSRQNTSARNMLVSLEEEYANH